MYGGTMYKGTQVQSYRNLRFGMSRSNSSVSHFNRRFNAPSQNLRYQTYLRNEKLSVWSRMKAGLFKKRDTLMMDTDRYKHSGLSSDNRRLSRFSKGVRIDNGQKGTQRISVRDINKFIDPRAGERSKGGIPVQGPVEVIPLK